MKFNNRNLKLSLLAVLKLLLKILGWRFDISKGDRQQTLTISPIKS